MTQRSKQTLITFSGAGATGKTTLVDALAAKFPVDGCVVHRSIVRRFYKENGIENENAFLLMPAEERRDFQMRLIGYYMTDLENAVKVGGAPVMICERSIFDHFAYTLYGTRELLRAEDMVFLRECIVRFTALRPCTFYLPYPTPWDSAGADGFRAREVAKDTLVDAMIFKLLSTNRSVWTGVLDFMPVQERAKKVLQLVFSTT